ncbi:lysosome-associated membrane glycoprotein 1-like [Tachypleus tridentatus]|uniref:lysosome-associated membrane glycoprotein 1-like n=1 Tax=Tachypleus tridentatus TaxID=6853 RepID=UPI003FD2D10C
MKLTGLAFILLSFLAFSSEQEIVLDINNTSSTEDTTIHPPSTTKNDTEDTPHPTSSEAQSSSTSAPNDKWTVKNKNETCIILTMDSFFSIKYKSNKNIGTGKLAVPKHSLVDTNRSTCSAANYTQIIVLHFNNNSLMMTFTKSDKTVSITQMKLNYTLDDVNFPNASYQNETKEVEVNDTLFKVDQGKSYVCNKAQNIDFNVNVRMTISNLQVEAFRTDNSSDFSKDTFECIADDEISDIVPIAVGCALAGLVLIVLIAYIVGRHRNRKKSYQSM